MQKKSAKELFYARKNIVHYFKEGIFPYKDNVFKTKEKKISRRIRRKNKR